MCSETCALRAIIAQSAAVGPVVPSRRPGLAPPSVGSQFAQH